MSPRYTLPARAETPSGSATGRLRDFLAKTWRGRILLGSLAVWILAALGLPVPLGSFAGFVVCCFGLYYGFKLLRFALRRLLWRIRSKLLLSYLFIAVVPVVLLTCFFLLAGLLGMSLVTSYMVTSSVDRTAEELRTLARTTLAAVDPSDPARNLAARIAPIQRLHPDLSYSLVRKGKVIASSGDAPREIPAWIKDDGFAGAVKVGKKQIVRALANREGVTLVLDVPMGEALFAEVERRTGFRVFGSEHPREDGPSVGVTLQESDAPREPGAAASIRRQRSGDMSGVNSVAVVTFTKWDSGEPDLDALALRVRPRDLLARLTPVVRSSETVSDVLIKVLAAVGVVFLVMYAVALLLGLLLARSVTASVHSLSVGTERLRLGDFDHPIQVRSRDQLGELAESFNMMARGIQDLLREQAEKERLEEELRIARQIQMSLLPQGQVTVPGVRIAALCLPAAEVGGDYYDLLPLSETRMGVLVADVSGKGTSAALYMAELKGLVLSLSRIYESPARLLSEANRILAANMDSRSFITMTYAVVDSAARTMRYARAGHNPIIQLEGGSGRTRVLTPQGLGLGLDTGDRFDEILEEAEVPLASGDVFLFFTDGLSEAMNSSAELFGERRLRDLIEDVRDGDEGALKDRILAAIRAFVGEAAQHDDMTLVILKVV